MAFSRRRPLSASTPQIALEKPSSEAPEASPAEGLDGQVLPPHATDIPPHVWAMLQEAGEVAAHRLVQLLRSKAFLSYAPTAQKALIELALTRAYGLPVRKALNVNLSTSDADAVAASLADLAQALPEHAAGRVRDGLAGLSGDTLAET